MENHQFNGKTHYKWPFSIAMLNYQRVGFGLINDVSKKIRMVDGDFSLISNIRLTRRSCEIFLAFQELAKPPLWLELMGSSIGVPMGY